MGETGVRGRACAAAQFLEFHRDMDACPFKKRRKTEWIKEYIRGELDPELQLTFNSRHIISNVNSYAAYIDALNNDFYMENRQTFLVLSRFRRSS